MTSLKRLCLSPLCKTGGGGIFPVSASILPSEIPPSPPFAKGGVGVEAKR
jgi:hypothetical protein